MSDIAPSVPMPVLKTEPGGNLTHVGDINNSLIGVSQLSSVVIGMSGNANSGGIMMPTIINDESISEPQSPISSGIFNFKQSSQWDFYDTKNSRNQYIFSLCIQMLMTME